MQVTGDKNQISDDVFDFMISYLPFSQKSIRSEHAKLFPSVYKYRPIHVSANINSNLFKNHLNVTLDRLEVESKMSVKKYQFSKINNPCHMLNWSFVRVVGLTFW